MWRINVLIFVMAECTIIIMDYLSFEVIVSCWSDDRSKIRFKKSRCPDLNRLLCYLLWLPVPPHSAVYVSESGFQPGRIVASL